MLRDLAHRAPALVTWNISVATYVPVQDCAVGFTVETLTVAVPAAGFFRVRAVSGRGLQPPLCVARTLTAEALSDVA